MNIQSTVKSLDFTGNDDHVIKTKQPERVEPHRPEFLEQNKGLSMNNISTPGNAGVVQFVDVHDLIRSKTPLEAARAALRAGLLPLPLHAIGTAIKSKSGDKVATGKEPVWFKWQEKKEITDTELRRGLSVKGRGVGLRLGPTGRVIDIEIDAKGENPAEFAELADAELAALFGGEIPSTAGWMSARGRHRLFLWDDRLKPIFDNEIAVVEYGRLEIRLGAGKGAQSAIPPTIHQSGERSWFDETVVASLNDAAISNLLKAADKQMQAKKTKRLIGQCQNFCDQIRSAQAGDKATGRHPTALKLARTMAGLIAGENAAELEHQCKSMLLEAYRNSKPELAPDDGEFMQCIGDGWFNGAIEPMQLHDRPLNGQKKPEPTKAEPTPRKQIGKAATLADIRRLCSDREFVWPWWMARKCLNLVDGKPGVGKSRFILDLIRRCVIGEIWPDGCPSTLPPDSKFLWIASDGNFDQLVETAESFGIPDEAIIFPGDAAEPFDFTDLSDWQTLDVIKQRIIEEKPVAVVIDTATSALGNVQQTDRTGIAAIAKSLREIARETNVAIILIGHQNKAGGSYGDAWPGVVDSRITLEPDGQEIRVELTSKARWNHLKAPILHSKQSDSGWEFKVESRDLESVANPPSGNATDQAKAAVLEYVARYPEMKKSDVVARVAEISNYARGTCYRAIDELLATDQIVEFEKDFGKFKAGCLILGPPGTVQISKNSFH